MAAQGLIDRGHLQADDAAAQDQQPLGDGGQLQGAGGVHHPRVLVGEAGDTHRGRAAGDDGVVEQHIDVALAGLDADAVGGLEAARALHHPDLALLGHGRQAAGELGYHLVLVGAQLVDVDLRLAEGNAQVGHLARLVEDGRGVQQGLGGDAAHVQADPAQVGVALDQDHALAEVRGAEGGGIAAGAGAEDDDLGLDILGWCDCGLVHGDSSCRILGMGLRADYASAGIVALLR